MAQSNIEATISFQFNNPNDPNDMTGQEILFTANPGRMLGAVVRKYRTTGYLQDKYDLFFNTARYAEKYSVIRVELPDGMVYLTPRNPADRRSPFPVSQFKREIQEDRQRRIEASKTRRMEASKTRKN